MKLAALTLAQALKVLKWREGLSHTLRTSHPLTEQEQTLFYRDVITNPGAPHRYFAIMGDPVNKIDNYLGMGGLTHISWENGSAEISLILDPEYRGHGFGEKAVGLLLGEAFSHLRLHSVYGECYGCSPALKFWQGVGPSFSEYLWSSTTLPHRKFYQGKYFDSFYFTWRKP